MEFLGELLLAIYESGGILAGFGVESQPLEALLIFATLMQDDLLWPRHHNVVNFGSQQPAHR